ncbi:hypothetical protein SPHINGO391_470243 [Sphingomonas aurantiaca]|uniref:Uncharacterized protein n=1 Tax=Sphingomonas aurantiaca TaxID=185949 RepID=A0A5E7ZS56_9SPHN|nr:hypothetical protein SPHINGO391_470243 [Sphingomonas aurantiaca]
MMSFVQSRACRGDIFPRATAQLLDSPALSPTECDIVRQCKLSLNHAGLMERHDPPPYPRAR